MTFCPLTKEECREDCEWASVIVEMDEDGISSDTFCAVTLVGAWCLNNTYGEDDAYFDE